MMVLYSDYFLEMLFFQFLGCGISVQIPILTGVQKGHITDSKSGHILLKNVLLKLNFQGEGY